MSKHVITRIWRVFCFSYNIYEYQKHFQISKVLRASVSIFVFQERFEF